MGRDQSDYSALPLIVSDLTEPTREPTIGELDHGAPQHAADVMHDDITYLSLVPFVPQGGQVDTHAEIITGECANGIVI